MNQVVKISLITRSYTLNEIGVSIPTEKKNDVFASVYSISQAEFYRAGQDGLRPQAVYAVRVTEYNNEDEIEVNSERLSVYRTYVRVDGRIELYTAKRKGDYDIIHT